MTGDFNILFSITDRIYRQKINKETEKLKNTIDQIVLMGIDRTLNHSKIHIFLKCTQNILMDGLFAG